MANSAEETNETVTAHNYDNVGAYVAYAKDFAVAHALLQNSTTKNNTTANFSTVWWLTQGASEPVAPASYSTKHFADMLGKRKT